MRPGDREQMALRAAQERWRTHRAAHLLYPAYQAGVARVVAGLGIGRADWWPELAPLTKLERQAVRDQLAAFLTDARAGQESGR